MNTRYQQALAEPEFDALIISFGSTASGDLAQQAAAMLESAVQQVLDRTAAGWEINEVPGLSSYFDLIPPPDQPVSIKQGFDLKNILKKEPTLEHVDTLFETNLDNIPEDDGGVEGDMMHSLFSTPWESLTETERNPLWNHELINTAEAWEHSRGQGIIIGHPDSGYIPHFELDDDRIRHDLERNFYDEAPGAVNSEERGGNHGLSTASVLISGSAQPIENHFVTGIAPEATLVPLRITKKGAPIFFSRSGPRRVRNAIRHAIDSGCHVISMSLGGPFERTLHMMIQEAVDKNIIVCAAAGNVVRIVVWPARYEEVIAVAACTADRKKWFHSSRGPTVDITAPGHNVWRAYIDKLGNESIAPSSGTSYATPHVAGIAALWLAKHGREELLEKYERVSLSVVFRHVLKKSCDPLPDDDRAQFGAGIVNAARTLAAALPDEQELLDEMQVAHLGQGLLEAAPTEVDYFNTIFDTLPKAEVRRRLAAMLDVPEAELEARLRLLNTEELAFFLMTDPELREFMTEREPTDAALEPLADLQGINAQLETQLSGRRLHENLMALPLSNELRAQMQIALPE